MQFSKKLIIASLLIVCTFTAGGGSFDYSQYGANWTTGSCSTNKKEQSPIDYVPGEMTSKTDFGLSVTFYDGSLTGSFEVPSKTSSSGQKMAIKLTNAGSNQISTLSSKILEDGKSYEFKAQQFHIHAGAEHTVGGDRPDAELHIVHSFSGSPAPTRNHAVLGIFFKVDKDAKDADTIIGKLGLTSSTTTANKTYNPSTIFSSVDVSDGFYAYKGGLTTPGCGEVVNWFSLKKMYPITQAQLDILNGFFKTNTHFGSKENYRKVQELGSRTVYCSTSGCGKKAGGDDDEKFSNIVGFPLLVLAFLFMVFY